ncbi:hypothetical protein COOONC_20068 [Cooperia oncophora]
MISGLGLEQFDYSEEQSGFRYGCRSEKSRESNEKLFNPYQFFGNAGSWPRGFPLEYLQVIPNEIEISVLLLSRTISNIFVAQCLAQAFQNHTNDRDQFCLCHKMRTAAVQQGLVHNDPDVDAVYRYPQKSLKKLEIIFSFFKSRHATKNL